MSYFENIEQFKSDFFSNYNLNIKKITKKYEKERIIRLILSIVLTICLVGFGLYIIYCAISVDGDIYFDGFMGGIVVTIFGFIPYYLFKKYFEDKVKKEIMSIFQKNFNNITWSQKYNGNYKEFLNANLFSNFWNAPVQEYYDDVFSGRYKKVYFNIVEVEYRVGHCNKGNYAIFKGLIIKLSTNKNATSNSGNCKLNLHKLKDYNIEVYTDNKDRINNILNPLFIKKLKYIKSVFKSKKIRLSFVKNTLMIAFYTKKDLFSIGSLIKPINDFKQFNTLCEQLVLIFEMIDCLYLL